MHIVVFGASGHVGKLIVAELQKRGHTVTAFIHTKPLAADGSHLKTIKGDVRNAAAVATALKGQDVVICALSSWKSKDKAVLSGAMRTIIPIAEQSGVKRLISLTGNVATAPGDKPKIAGKLVRIFFRLIARGVLHDGESHIAMLAHSSLHWTVVRSPVMILGTSTGYSLNLKASSLFVPRLAVAQCMVDMVEDNVYIQAAPFIKSA